MVGLGTHLSKKLSGADILSSKTGIGLEFPEQKGYCCELQGKQAVKGLSWGAGVGWGWVYVCIHFPKGTAKLKDIVF